MFLTHCDYVILAISVLKEKEPGCFIVRDSHSFKGAYGLAMKVATPPPSVIQQSRKGVLHVVLFCDFTVHQENFYLPFFCKCKKCGP